MKIGLFFLITLPFLWNQEGENAYAKARDLYSQGNLAEDTFVKNGLYNHALSELLEIPEESVSKNQLIGEVLARLGQNPLALYYYLQALELDPENRETLRRIEHVIKEGKLTAKVPAFPFFRKEQILFSILFVAWILLFSWAIWRGKRSLQKGSLFLAIPLFSYGAYIAIRIFFSPIFGVMIHSQGLYQEAGLTKPLLGPIPLDAGVIVTVLNVEEQGDWLKIRTPEGAMGYVPEKAIRVVH